MWEKYRNYEKRGNMSKKFPENLFKRLFGGKIKLLTI